MQFARFVGNAARLNFGNSYQFKTPVIDLIADRFPATMELAFASALFSLLIGIPMGVYTALHRRSILSNIFLAASLIGISLPTFLIGILLIFLFPVTLGVLPSFGRGDVVRHRLLDHRPAHGVRPQGAGPARRSRSACSR